jgi:hypothetical protein
MASALDAKFPATADKTSFTPNRPGFSSREYMPALSTGVPVAFNLSPSFLPYVNNQQEIAAGVMHSLMNAFLPEKALRDIIYFAAIGDVNQTFPPIILLQFLSGKSPHRDIPDIKPV